MGVSGARVRVEKGAKDGQRAVLLVLLVVLVLVLMMMIVVAAVAVTVAAVVVAEEGVDGILGLIIVLLVTMSLPLFCCFKASLSFAAALKVLETDAVEALADADAGLLSLPLSRPLSLSLSLGSRA